MRWYARALMLLLIFAAMPVLAQRIVVLNPCYDEWLPQWLPASWQIIPSDAHKNRLETITGLRPTVVVAGSFTDHRLLTALREFSKIIVIQQPSDLAQWHDEVLRAAQLLDQQQAAQQWLGRQQQQLNEAAANHPQSVLIIMPNQFTWGPDSWTGNLLRAYQIPLVTPLERGQLGQLNLEQLLGLTPERVVVEGFSEDYARAQDWLWHSAVSHWLKGRELSFVAPEVAGCPAVKAVDYLQQIVGSTS
ncbi:ABC transporter substrate-binding protein [Pseudidiomarina sp.]|uniref:ABC transporter substrate-binding protein n=1 Tax=Pseudidiomarina sp. TaxID=2081707 RepID=UPI00299EF13C|nr:ABC transporter substrate-binding protein [Pseudidiomarina sp.]MDX1706243.1 ABC transporter substrate-binding protein [Pseudidiomarina sp.]